MTYDFGLREGKVRMAPQNSPLSSKAWISLIRSTALVASVVGTVASLEAQPPVGQPRPGQPKAGAPAAKKKATEIPMEELKIDPNALPHGYSPPPERLPIYDLDIERPILTKEERDSLAKDASKFSKTKNDCDTSPAGRKIVENTVRYRLSELTLKEKLEDLPTLRRKFVEQIQINSAKRPEEVRGMAQLIGQSIVNQAPELLKNQYIVRIQAAELLGEIDYAPAHEVLLKVIQAKDIKEDEAEGQPEGVKIAAAKSLIRILRYANLPVRDRSVVAHAVITQLENHDAFSWLQMLYIDALRYCDISGVDSTNNDKAFVVDALMDVIKDERRPWTVRTRACYAIGRVPLPKASVKVDDVVTAVSECALQLSNAAAAKPNNPEWRNCFWYMYLAFHNGATTKDPDKDAEKKIAGGLLEKVKPSAQKAYDVFVPIVNDVLNGKAPDAGNLRNLSEFVRSRQSRVGQTDGAPAR